MPLAFILLVITSCGIWRKSSHEKYFKTFIPPGTIKISDNFYCDQTEVTNLQWREYVYWNGRVFGKNSPEYYKTLPDTGVWRAKIAYNEPLVTEYFRGAYWDYPVVGISQEQARNYSLWRSDRVFEYLLIRNKVIKPNPYQNKKNYFSIDNYFKATYNGIIPDSNFRYYPVFDLPDFNERKQILKYEDSLEKKYLKSCRGKFCNECRAKYPYARCEYNPKDLDMPTPWPVKSGYIPFTKGTLFNLRGNVSEWTKDTDITAGGGWLDKREMILRSDTIKQAYSSAWTGFRNVCKWKKWTD